MSDGLLATLAAIAFVFGAFYSGSETAFLSVSRIRLRHLAARGNQRAQRALDMLEDPGHLMSAILVGTNTAVTACTTATTAIATRHFGDSGATIATAFLVPTFLLFNEIIPKGIFLYYANRAVVMSVDILRTLTRFLHPIVIAFARTVNAITSLLPAPHEVRISEVNAEEMVYHIADSREAGLISPETKALADRALELRELRVRDLYTPLDEVVMLDGNDPPESYGAVFAREGFSRFPVFRGERSNVIAVVSAHEYMTSPDPAALLEEMPPPDRVPLDQPLVDLLLRMRVSGRHMVVVHDASGIVVGMTTLEDILERVVGAIADEFH
jgi:putative hemolysin